MSREPSDCTDDGRSCSSSGPSARQAASPNTSRPEDAEIRARLAERMGRIRHKLVVLSGKGGVGKSTVAVNLAVALAQARPESRVGLLDVDLHGPSVPRMLHLEGSQISGDAAGMQPVLYDGRLPVMSIGFLLHRASDAVIWRGPRKFGAIRQLLANVQWGDLDYLVIDSPPGTGDEPLAVCELVSAGSKKKGSDLSGGRGAVIVTTPQGMAIADVRKCVNFCREVGMPIHGVIENMSHLVCPHCSETIHVFDSGGGEAMAREMKVPFLGSLPLVPAIVESGERGCPLVLGGEGADDAVRTSGAAETFRGFAATLIEQSFPESKPRGAASQDEQANGLCLRYAIPIDKPQSGARHICAHFGQCEWFALIDVDPLAGRVSRMRLARSPKHEPGVLPAWIHEQGADVVITGGMGAQARDLLTQNDIEVVVGINAGTPEELALGHLRGTLEGGPNACTH